MLGMTQHLAQLNLARLVAPLDDPRLADFMAGLPKINAVADTAPGFVWRLVDDDGGDATSLRPFGDDVIVNLTVWQRREWFVPFGDVYAVNWWVPAGHRPSVFEARERLERLREHGSTPSAFTLREPFPMSAG